MAHPLYYHIRVKLFLSKPPMFGGANTLLIVFGMLAGSLQEPINTPNILVGMWAHQPQGSQEASKLKLHVPKKN